MDSRVKGRSLARQVSRSRPYYDPYTIREQPVGSSLVRQLLAESPDGRLRLWRGRGVTGVAFIAARARLRDVLRAETDVPDVPGSLAAVLERAFGKATGAKAFGTLAAKEAWTHRPATRTTAADLGATAERQSV